MRSRNIFKKKRKANCLPHALLFQKGHDALFRGTVPKVSLKEACDLYLLNRSVQVAPWLAGESTHPHHSNGKCQSLQLLPLLSQVPALRPRFLGHIRWTNISRDTCRIPGPGPDPFHVLRSEQFSHLTGEPTLTRHSTTNKGPSFLGTQGWPILESVDQERWLSKGGPWTTASSSPGTVSENRFSGTPQTCSIGNSGGGPRNPCFNMPSGEFRCTEGGEPGARDSQRAQKPSQPQVQVP